MCTPTFVPPFGPRSQWVAVALPILVLFLLWTWIVYRYGVWDWLLISGWATFALAILVSNRLPSVLAHCLKRLAHRGVSAVPDTRLAAFVDDLECRRAPRYALWLGGTLAVRIGIAFFVAFDLRQLQSRMSDILRS